MLTSLVDHWMYRLYEQIERTLIQNICPQTMSGYPHAFDSMVIDLIESIPYKTYGYFITKDIDADGWFYIKGQFAVDTRFMLEFPPSASELGTLTDGVLVVLLKELFNLARYRCLNFLRQLDWKSPKLLIYRKQRFLPEQSTVFNVDQKYKKELAPVDQLLKLLKEKSCYDNNDESAFRAHTVQEPSSDLEVKLQIDWSHPSGLTRT
jgi:hypothetical protein